MWPRLQHDGPDEGSNPRAPVDNQGLIHYHHVTEHVIVHIEAYRYLQKIAETSWGMATPHGTFWKEIAHAQTISARRRLVKSETNQSVVRQLLKEEDVLLCLSVSVTCVFGSDKVKCSPTQIK